MVTKYLSPSKLEPEPLKKFLAGNFGFTVAYIISQSPDQLETLPAQAGRCEPGSTSSGREGPEAQPESDADSQRSKSVKSPLDGDIVSIKGKNLSLTGPAKLLADAEREVKAGVKDGQALKTFTKVMADRASKAAKDAEAKQTPPATTA